MKKIVTLLLGAITLGVSCQKEQGPVQRENLRAYTQWEHQEGYTFPNGYFSKPEDIQVIHIEFTLARMQPHDKSYYIEFSVPCKDAGGTLRWRDCVTVPANTRTITFRGLDLFSVTKEEAQQISYTLIPLKVVTDLTQIINESHNLDMQYADHPIMLKPWLSKL